MMKHLLILLVILVSTKIESKAQTQSVYLELGGQSVLYSLNYEYQFDQKKNKALFLRGGLEVLPVSGYDKQRTEFAMPIEVGYVFGRSKHHFEASTAILMITEGENSPTQPRHDDPGRTTITYLWSTRIGYRYQKPDGHFLFRAGLTPINARVNFSKTDGFLGFVPFGGICLGYVI